MISPCVFFMSKLILLSPSYGQQTPDLLWLLTVMYLQMEPYLEGFVFYIQTPGQYLFFCKTTITATKPHHSSK